MSNTYKADIGQMRARAISQISYAELRMGSFYCRLFKCLSLF